MTYGNSNTFICFEVILPNLVLQSYLSLLEGLSSKVSPAGSLEHRDVPPGLNIPLLLQPGKNPRSEEHLEMQSDHYDKVTHVSVLHNIHTQMCDNPGIVL